MANFGDEWRTAPYEWKKYSLFPITYSLFLITYSPIPLFLKRTARHKKDRRISKHISRTTAHNKNILFVNSMSVIFTPNIYGKLVIKSTTTFIFPLTLLLGRYGRFLSFLNQVSKVYLSSIQILFKLS